MSHSHVPISVTPTDILAQCCVAFGKGAGTYDLTDEALHSMAEFYLAEFSRAIPLDGSAREMLLRNAEELGRKCSGSEKPITGAAIKDALDQLKEMWKKGFPICLCAKPKS